MLEPFKLIKEEFNDFNNEKLWTYSLEITFNSQLINKLTITSYYQTRLGRETITNELIWNIFQNKLHNQLLKPLVYRGKRKVFKWEEIYQDHKYRLIFWFKDQADNHLWVRNCYRVD